MRLNNQMTDKEDKYKQIFLQHKDMIYRLCCSYCPDPELRKDLFQNILMRIWKGLKSFEGRSALSTWVYRIAVNTGIDFLRRENNAAKLSRQVDISELELADKAFNTEEQMIISEKNEFIYKCINELSFIDKTIITLYLEEFSYKMISEIIGISDKNVSVKLARIKKKLNKCLRDYLE